MNNNEIKREIFSLVTKYYEQNHTQTDDERVNYAGRAYDQEEMINLVDASLDFWLTEGNYSKELMQYLCEFLNVKYCALVNSGSSANLIALSSLTSPSLGERRISKGDEVISVAASFPTTINPILQVGAVPVFIDIDNTLNISIDHLEQALSSKTKAVMIAHTLGNPFHVQSIYNFCKKYNLWLIEDNCDALGAQVYFNNKWVSTGTVGDISTLSFYPSHHMTTGEGGAILTQSPILNKIIKSFRDWGRDCWCPGGLDNTCGKRFSQSFKSLPESYDHKYIYSHLGYNLKMTDLQAAIGCAQIKKVPTFIEKRKRNWTFLYENLKRYHQFFSIVEAYEHSNPSWFGFYFEVKESAPFERFELVKYLENNDIQTRLLFAGNITLQPYFEDLKEGADYRIASPLIKTNRTMNNGLWIGVNPTLNDKQREKVIRCFDSFLKPFHE